MGRFAICVVLVGCGGPAAEAIKEQPSTPLAKFPAADALAKVRSAPLKADGSTTTALDRWELDVSPPLHDAQATADDEKRTRVLAPRARVNANLACAAHELARMVASNKGTPPAHVRHWIVARCGGTQVDMQMASMRWQHVEKITDDEILAKSAGKLGTGNPPPEVQAGAAVARDGENAAVVLVLASPAADIHAWTPPKASDTAVTIAGRLRVNAEQLVAAVNQGEFGFAYCKADPGMTLPEFSFECPLASGDKSTWVELLGRQRDAVLAHDIASALVVREGETVPYEVPHEDAVPAADPEAFTRALFERINAVRSRAQLGALALAPEQTVTSSRVVATLINASLEGDVATTNTLSLALLAGWDVKGTIRFGDFFTGYQPGAPDAAAWMRQALQSPAGRVVLLEPDRSLVALGSAFTEKKDGAGAVVSTFSLFDGYDHGTDGGRVIQKLNELRAAKGFAPCPTTPIPEIRFALEGITANEPPMRGAKKAMNAAAERFPGKRIRIWAVETTSLDHVPFPDELLRATALPVAAAATHHKAEGGAWGQFVVFVMAIETPAMDVAGRPVTAY